MRPNDAGTASATKITSGGYCSVSKASASIYSYYPGTQPQFVYRHCWTVGDLVIWDNRCTMHRGRPYDDTQRRVLHRTTVSDIANTLEQEGLAAPYAA